MISAERLVAAGAFAVVALGVSLGFATLGTPAHQRAEALDRAALVSLYRRAAADTSRRRVLCADFRLRSSGSDVPNDPPHPAGHVCFTFPAGSSSGTITTRTSA
jgi:hypothetical protein